MHVFNIYIMTMIFTNLYLNIFVSNLSYPGLLVSGYFGTYNFVLLYFHNKHVELIPNLSGLTLILLLQRVQIQSDTYPLLPFWVCLLEKDLSI